MKKKLLILGGTSISRQIVYAARDLNFEVYVTDYFEDSPCKKIADKSFMVSCTDVDAVVNLIKEEEIDGVIMGYADVLMPAYVQICKKANIPCYANIHAIEVTSNKALFKNLCRKFNISVVPEYTLDEVKSDRVKYPVLVKPVDNSGARGIYICHNREEFDKYYIDAMNFSPSKTILIERFLEAPESTAFYYLHDGDIYLMGVSDRHMLKFNESMLQLPVGYTFPSKDQSNYIAQIDIRLKELFHSLDMKEGMVFVQSFNEDGNFVIYEVGYRLTGSLEHYLMEKAYGFNHLKEILNFAVGNRIDTTALRDEVISQANLANVTLLLSQGVIDHYEGVDECLKIPGVIHIHESYDPGAVIDSSIMGKLSQVGIRILLSSDSQDNLINLMDKIKDTLHVISTEGNDMLIRNYSYKTIIN